MTVVGLLHPGSMGAEVGRVAGAEVLWAPEDRSTATAARAARAGLTATPLEELLRRADIVLSICPPHAALEVARGVAAHGFAGLYCDANAISPATAVEVARTVRDASFVDGGIVGGPPTEPGTRLYLSGERADAVAALFAGTLLEPVVVGGEPGTASALKACYAGWSKGSAALLLALADAAEALGVWPALEAEWQRSVPDTLQRLARARRSAAAKGWRWVGEMEEIAATLRAAGEPDGFHTAAADVFRRV